MTIAPIALNDLTQATLAGTGVFDVLMRTNKAHLESEFSKGRIKGTEYATVYLGSLEAVLTASLSFLLQKDKSALEAQLIEQQVLVAQQQVLKTQAEILQVEAQVALTTQQQANLVAELAIIQANALKVPAEVAHIQAQTLLLGQQKINLASENLGIVAKTALTTQQTANAVIEGTVLQGQKCKLDAEYDVLMLTKQKTVEETGLLLWKTNTEKAQTLSGADENSVVGKQKSLYAAQTSGFIRDAEQKAAKVMVDSWNVRRTTDEGVMADPAGVGDAAVARAVNKLLSGVGA